MEKIIKISYEDSNYIERLFFEYNASLNIIAFLMSKEEVKQKHLQLYLDSSEKKYTELELAKKQIIKKYKPKDIIEETQYFFNFDNEEIIFKI